MSKSKVKLIGVTLGDPGGIGPEVAAKALASFPPGMRKRFLLVGEGGFSKSLAGKMTLSGARAALGALQSAVRLLHSDEIAGVVTAPVCKESIQKLEKNFKGHTEYFAQAFGVSHVDMMFVSPRLKVVVATRHLALKEVSQNISRQGILETLVLTRQALGKLFQIKNPVIGVCGLNPHAGEGGLMGREELDVIIPALKLARRRGIKVEGPLAADTLFQQSR